MVQLHSGGQLVHISTNPTTMDYILLSASLAAAIAFCCILSCIVWSFYVICYRNKEKTEGVNQDIEKLPTNLVKAQVSDETYCIVREVRTKFITWTHW